MAQSSSAKKKSKAAGRRANYAPKPHEVGIRKHLPLGWANWLGFVLFGLLSLACLAGAIDAAIIGENADIFAALLMCGLFSWMTVLFAITRWEDDF